MPDATGHQGFLDRHYLLLRRLHSLTGVMPIGVYLFPHLTTNSSIVWGRWLSGAKVTGAGIEPHAGVETFQHEVDFLHGLPALVLIEIFGIWLPIAYHMIVGIWFATTGRTNVDRYPYQDNWRYTLQRLTGYVGVLFIVMHIASLRWGITFLGLMPSFDPHAAASTTAIHFQDGAWGLFIPLFYLVGVLALVFHFANGLWTAAITWGLTVSVGAQRRWGYVCVAIGLGLAAAGVASVVGFTALDADGAARIERRLLESGRATDALPLAGSPLEETRP